MKRKIFEYPVEYLGEAFIHPMTMRKAELADLLGITWQQVRTEINEDPELFEKLKDFRYRPVRKFLFPAQVAILFYYFGPPLASTHNKAIIKRIKGMNHL